MFVIRVEEGKLRGFEKEPPRNSCNSHALYFSYKCVKRLFSPTKVSEKI